VFSGFLGVADNIDDPFLHRQDGLL